MSFENKTPTTPTPAPATLKPEQHHLKVAEHLELAAKSHKEVAKLIGVNDHSGASAHVKVAQEHWTQAQTHAAPPKKPCQLPSKRPRSLTSRQPGQGLAAFLRGDAKAVTFSAVDL